MLRTIAVLAGATLSLAGCSSTPKGASGAPTADRPSATQAGASVARRTGLRAYRDAVLRDRPVGMWPLDDVAAARPGRWVRALAGDAARMLQGPVAATAGPSIAGQPTRAASFTGAGRLVTDLVDPLTPGRRFTVELFFRPDSCARAWTQALGNATYDARGRQGLNFLHYPRFWRRHCRLWVEFWKDNRWGGGCGAPAVTETMHWIHFALTYDREVARCYAGGRLVGRSRVRRFGTTPGAPFGIGGAGGGYAGTLDSGSISEVAVYPRVLSVKRIRRHAALAHVLGTAATASGITH